MLWNFAASTSIKFLELHNPICFDLSNVHTLVFESCSGLNEAFNRFKKAIAADRTCQTTCKSKLKSLTIRHDQEQVGSLTDLCEFVCALSGLTHLSVLLDGYDPQIIDPILRQHGKTLRSLVWDERRTSRIRADETVHTFITHIGRLCKIARHCPNLSALGMAFNWLSIIDNETYCERVRDLQQP